MEDKEIVINKWKAWNFDGIGVFISKTDDAGTIWIKKEEFGDLKELLKRIEDKFTLKKER